MLQAHRGAAAPAQRLESGGPGGAGVLGGRVASKAIPFVFYSRWDRGARSDSTSGCRLATVLVAGRPKGEARRSAVGFQQQLSGEMTVA